MAKIGANGGDVVTVRAEDSRHYARSLPLTRTEPTMLDCQPARQQACRRGDATLVRFCLASVASEGSP